MKITWIGHSCFKIEQEGYTLITDPYEDGSVPGLKNLREKANKVLCSHEHGDHNARSRVTLTEAAKDQIIEDSYDPNFGARPLKRYIQRKVETLIARKIIAGQVSEGDDLVVDAADGELYLR